MSVIAVKGTIHGEGIASFAVGYDGMTSVNSQNMKCVSTLHKVHRFTSDNGELLFGNVGYTKRMTMMKAFMHDNAMPSLMTIGDVLDFMSDFYNFSTTYLESDRNVNYGSNNNKDYFDGESILINKFGNKLEAWSFNHFSVKPIDKTGVFSIGSGSKAALGALHVGAGVREAVEATCKVDKSCGPPVYEQLIQYEL